MAVKLLFQGIPQFEDSSGNPYTSARLFFYQAGSSTKLNTYSDNGGLTANDNPITLNSSGYPAVSGNIVQIWGTTGQTYKIGLAAPGSDDPPASFIWSADNVSPINDTTVSIDQWVTGPTPTYVSATSFTLSGDQTSTFHISRRLKTTNSGGTIYSTITNAVFGALTTITVANDSGTLDSGLSAVSYGLVTAVNHSIPAFQAKGDILTQSAAGTIARLAAGTSGYKVASESGTTSGLFYQPPEAGSSIINGYLDWSVAASALTVAVKGWDGNDPSASNPVYVVIRSTTAATGLPSILKLTAATSVVVSSGSTLGTRSSIPFRVWVVGFNDAATFRLGVINCVTSTAGTGAGSDVTGIYPLKGWAIAGSTAEGGAGAADSSQVFYTGSAVSAKPYTTLGYATWESGLGTAGTWSAGPTRSQLYGAGVPLPGDIIQIQRNQTGAVATGTGEIPNDDTIPQSSEGDQYMTQAITPSSAANALRTEAQWNGACSSAGSSVVTFLVQDSTANALAVVPGTTGNNAGSRYSATVKNTIVAATTSATTMKLRFGAITGTGGTNTFNGAAAARLYGGTISSYMNIEEIMG